MKEVIKSVNTDQHEIIRNIIDLHCGGHPFEVDTTYSIGAFYYNRRGELLIPEPERAFDLYPQIDGVEQLRFPLPFEDGSVRSIMFDPPFIISSGPSMGNGNAKANMVSNRFSAYPNPLALFRSYDQNLREYYRILKDDGVLVVKCQAMVSGSKQYFIPEWLMFRAYNYGFYPLDRFELIAKSRIISGKHVNQQHARKFSSVFWVFKKCTPKVNYNQFNELLDIL